MTGKNIIRFAVAILASWAVMWAGRNRLPEPVTQGLSFWVMFLILPLTFSDSAANKKPSLARRALAATAGAAVVLVLYILVGGWRGN
jgi:hypothetical protein